jgi:hypothetical protein
MGGHGGLNILPQKKWNVYNWDNRIKVEQNEKKVQDEIDKRETEKKHRKIRDKIKTIKSGEVDDDVRFSGYEEHNKTKIYKEIIQREKILERLDNDMALEKLRIPMKADERLKLFDNEELEKKLERGLIAEDMGEVKQFTLKDSLSKNLKPWYIKKKKEDYAIYREFGKDEDIKADDDKLLKKKHKKEKKHKKKRDRSRSPKNEIEKFAFKLRREKEKVLKQAFKNN